MMDDELLDLVDKNDDVIGTINRMDYDRLIKDNLGYIRAIDLFILNSKGQIYTPVRTANKTIAPNGLDFSVGGHVGAGEDYLTALMREAEEEVGITFAASDVTRIAKIVDDKTRYIRSVYLLRSDETLTFNPHDFVSAEWLEPSEIIRKIDAGHPAKGSLRPTVVLLQEYLVQN